MTTIIDGTSGISTPMYNGSITANPVTPSVNMKNRIINGAMVIDQRNAGASVTLTSAGVYTVDRWNGVEDTDGAATAQQVSDAPAGFNYSLKFTTTTADASLSAAQYCSFDQRIEGYNIADLNWGSANAKTVTLSFWVKSSLTGTFGGALANSAFNRSYPFTYTISSANTWEQKSVTIAGDTSGTWGTTNGVGIYVQFGLGVGSTYSGTAGSWAAAGYISATSAVSVIGTLNATWQATGVQLEVGSTASSFDYRPYGTELQLCQRYYEAVTVQGGGFWYTVRNEGSTCRVILPWLVIKRATPTATVSGGVGSGTYAATASVLGTSVSGADCGGSSASSFSLYTSSAEL